MILFRPDFRISLVGIERGKSVRLVSFFIYMEILNL